MVEVGLDQASHYKHSPLQASEAGSIALFGVIPVCQPTEREEAVESSPVQLYLQQSHDSYYTSLESLYHDQRLYAGHEAVTHL